MTKMKKILQKEAPVLREICQNIPLNSIGSPKIQNIIKEMKIALASQDDGVAIAAPQIGYPLRIFVVSGRVNNITKKESVESRVLTKQNEDNKTRKEPSEIDTVFI